MHAPIWSIARQWSQVCYNFALEFDRRALQGKAFFVCPKMADTKQNASFMKSSKLSALIKSSRTQVSKAAASLKQAEEKSASLKAIYRGAKARLKDAKQTLKKAKTDWKSAQALIAGERKRLSKLLKKLERLGRKGAKSSAGSSPAKAGKSGMKG